MITEDYQLKKINSNRRKLQHQNIAFINFMNELWIQNNHIAYRTLKI